MLAGYGVSHVFMVPAVLRRTFAEMERRTQIARIHCHGEKAAAYMADGYARACGRPGVCMAQHVGALNLVAGLRDAWLAHSPVIAITGGRDPKTKFRKVYQEVDDVPAFEPVTKFNATVDDVARFPDMVRQAFRVAVSGTPGPVHLQFRGNEGQIDAEQAEMEPLVEERFADHPAARASQVRDHRVEIGRVVHDVQPETADRVGPPARQLEDRPVPLDGLELAAAQD
jgi:acetolactate synthase-1/2/3 large subunit